MTYFVSHYCHVYDATLKQWLRFALWDAQKALLEAVHAHNKVIALKARQLGISWCGIAYGLWLMVFHPISTIAVFSKGQDEANYMLGEERMRGMYNLLPSWMQPGVEIDNERVWKLNNGSVARSFSTKGGDSFTNTYVLIDEMDLIEDQGAIMKAVKPTIDGGGKMFSVSRPDAKRAGTEFKRIYRAATEGENSWFPVFLPWYVRPARTQEWYEDKKREIYSRTGSLDELHEQYPSTPEEALSGITQYKRIPPGWLRACFVEQEPLYAVSERPADYEMYAYPRDMPLIPGLRVYRAPLASLTYVAGADCAEGNVHSDPSSTHLVDLLTGECQASFAGQLTPEVHATYTQALCDWYNRAQVLPERNNHGHSFILQYAHDERLDRLLPGTDGKPGWLTTQVSKTLMYDQVSPLFREGDAVIHSLSTFNQLASIEAATQRAPEGEHDDEAISYCLALLARTRYAPPVEPASEPAYSDDDPAELTYRYS